MTSESEYEAEALSMLAQYGQTITLSGNGLAKCPYIYKEQYFVGDTITVAFSGKSAKVQILSITENWSGRGEYGIEFSFGKPQNNLSRQLQLILKQIQKASEKTTSTSSVKYYTIPTDTNMPKADVIYDTIGFIGECASGGSTFQLYWNDDKTGAKTYHVYFKQLAGGSLTLTTGVAGASNLVLNSGTYVAIIYVDTSGNITMAGSTPTNTVTANNVQSVSSGAVAEALAGKANGNLTVKHLYLTPRQLNTASTLTSIVAGLGSPCFCTFSVGWEEYTSFPYAGSDGYILITPGSAAGFGKFRNYSDNNYTRAFRWVDSISSSRFSGIYAI